jgi:hypothetical protein
MRKETVRRTRYLRSRDYGLFVLLFIGGEVVAASFWLIHPLLAVVVGLGFLVWFSNHMEEAKRKRDDESCRS